MSNKPSDHFLPSLGRLIGVAAIAGAATWIGASLLTTARAQPNTGYRAEVSVAAAAEGDTSSAASASPDNLEAKMRERRARELASEWAELAATTKPADGDRLEPSEAEWRAASEAMQSHTPNALHRIDRAPKNAPARGRMMRALVDRYRELQRIERRDPAQYKREIEQTELEDKILGLARQVAREQDLGSAYEARAQLRDLVTKLVDLRIANREARLEKLAATLESERQRLSKERQDRDKMIDRQVAEVVKRPKAGPRNSQPPTAPSAGTPELATPSPSGGNSR